MIYVTAEKINVFLAIRDTQICIKDDINVWIKLTIHDNGLYNYIGAAK